MVVLAFLNTDRDRPRLAIAPMGFLGASAQSWGLAMPECSTPASGIDVRSRGKDS